MCNEKTKGGIQMSYESVVEQLKILPEVCLDEVSKYLEFILYKYGKNNFQSLVETTDEFEEKLQRGFDDLENGNVTSLEDTILDIKRKFA